MINVTYATQSEAGDNATNFSTDFYNADDYDTDTDKRWRQVMANF